jgi:hypothetical protein
MAPLYRLNAWQLSPAFVKLDRRVIQLAETDLGAQVAVL